MKYYKNDFGSMGFSLSDLFSSPKKFSDAQNIAAGKNWIRAVYNELKPNATFAVFEDTLRLSASGGPKLTVEELTDFYKTVGFNFNTQPAIADKVKDSLVGTFSKNKNWLPDRKSIISAFMNPNVIKWTYWDAIKVASKDIAAEAKSVASDVVSVVSAATGAAGFVIKYRTPIILALLGGAAYFLYSNREEVKSRLKEKGFKAVGLGK